MQQSFMSLAMALDGLAKARSNPHWRPSLCVKAEALRIEAAVISHQSASRRAQLKIAREALRVGSLGSAYGL